MGTRVLRFIPNTPELVAWGQKPTTSHLSDLINNRIEGNILNSVKRCIAHMNKFSAHRIKRTSSLKYYIFGTFVRHKAGALQDALIIHLRMAMLLALRWPVLHKLLRIHLAPVHFSMGKRPTGTFNADEALDDFKPRAGIH